jgi:hypothetical protein
MHYNLSLRFRAKAVQLFGLWSGAAHGRPIVTTGHKRLDLAPEQRLDSNVYIFASWVCQGLPLG